MARNIVNSFVVEGSEYEIGMLSAQIREPLLAILGSEVTEVPADVFQRARRDTAVELSTSPVISAFFALEEAPEESEQRMERERDDKKKSKKSARSLHSLSSVPSVGSSRSAGRLKRAGSKNDVVAASEEKGPGSGHHVLGLF